MSTITSPPYDDVFKTLLNDCTKLIIPVINEFFGENYSGIEQPIHHSCSSGRSHHPEGFACSSIQFHYKK